MLLQGNQEEEPTGVSRATEDHCLYQCFPRRTKPVPVTSLSCRFSIKSKILCILGALCVEGIHEAQRILCNQGMFCTHPLGVIIYQRGSDTVPGVGPAAQDRSTSTLKSPAANPCDNDEITEYNPARLYADAEQSERRALKCNGAIAKLGSQPKSVSTVPCHLRPI